jgi:hypothetical protein
MIWMSFLTVSMSFCSVSLLSARRPLTDTDTVKTDIPGLFHYPLGLISGNSDHEQQKEKNKRDESKEYPGLVFSHVLSPAAKLIVC